MDSATLLIIISTAFTIMTSTCLARNILLNGEGLYACQSLDVGSYSLKMQDDCNLVLYDHNTPVWTSKTGFTGREGCRAVMQADGNFVIYDYNGYPVWASNSSRGNGNYVLVLQEDRNLVIYGPDIWSTRTNRKGVVTASFAAMNATVDAGFGGQNATVSVTAINATVDAGFGGRNATVSVTAINPTVEEAAAGI